MVIFTAKLDDGQEYQITETVSLDGKPCIEVGCTTPHSIGGVPVFNEIDTLSRREAERVALAILRAVKKSRRKHPPRKGWP